MIISLSILNVEKENRKSVIKDFMCVDNNWIHFDVMDGNFVEDETFKYEVVKEIGEYCDFFKDVHLMTYNPDEYIEQYKAAGTDQITFHYESVSKENIVPVINKIKDSNMKVGISIKPSTDIKLIEPYLPYLDLVLVMSVEPGKGGQKFMEDSLDKIMWLKNKQKENHFLISVDGGINKDTSQLVKSAGADVVVVGTYLTKSVITKDRIISLM